MLPQTVAGLLILVASTCPGYWWIRVLEEHKPRRERTQLLEAAELLSIGGLFSAVAFLIALAVADTTSWVDSRALFKSAHEYATAHPPRLALWLLATLVFANFAAWASAKLVYRKRSPIVHESALHRAVIQAPRGSRPLVTAVMTDGTSITGWFNACTADPASREEQELVLARLEDARVHERAVRIRLPASPQFVDLNDHCVVLSGAHLAATYVRFVQTGFEDTKQPDQWLGGQRPPSPHANASCRRSRGHLRLKYVSSERSAHVPIRGFVVNALIRTPSLVDWVPRA